MLSTELLSRREPEVGEEDVGTVLVAEDVEGFQVAMVDVVGVAMFHCVDDLEEGGLDSSGVAGICSVIVDHVVETTAGAVVE